MSLLVPSDRHPVCHNCRAAQVTRNIVAVEGVIKELNAKRRGLYEERDQKAHTMGGLQRDLTQVQGERRESQGTDTVN